MPVAVRPDVSAENLGQLLAEGHEYETLDYKRSCDLSNHDEELEIVKDICAMQLLGGYIVIGADDNGQPSGDVLPQHIPLFDESRLRAKVRKYIAEPFELRSRRHHLDGNDYILIYVGENPLGFCIFASIGNKTGGANVFKPGDVFARHGSASERWQHHDVHEIRRKIVERERDRWMAEFSILMDQRQPERQAPSTTPFKATLAWQLDSTSFRDAVVNHLRDDDLIPVELFLDSIPSEISKLLKSSDGQEQIETILDRLACLAALLLQTRQNELFQKVVKTYVSIYNLPVESSGARKSGISISPESLWFLIHQRLIGIGALAERLKNWGAIRFLVLQKGKGPDFDYWPNWYRHALTMAARSNFLRQERDGRRREEPILSFAQAQVERLECLHPDLPADDEEILNSLTRFDLLASVVGISDYGEPADRAFYPSFARYYSSRSTPAAERLLEDSAMRQELFPQSDRELAEALAAIGRMADSQAFSIAGWDGYRSEKVNSFIQRELRA